MKYNPHEYQSYATEFILSHPISAVFLEMGLGKSVITLSAIFDLCLDSFLVCKVLVIAPLRVARDTWPAEINKWDHLKGLSYSVAVGTEKERIDASRNNQRYTSSTVRTWIGWFIKVVFLFVLIWWSLMSYHPLSLMVQSGLRVYLK